MKDRAGYQFIDTNILIYAHDSSAGAKHTQAKELLQRLWETEEGCLSIQVLQEFYVTAATRKISQPLKPEQASEIIAAVGTWRVHQPTVEDIQEAIVIQERYQISFWDSMIIRSAICLDCHLLWSEDLNAGQQYERVQVLNPFSVE